MILHNSAPTFWRRIYLETGPKTAHGEVMDNVHHFIATLEHDGSVVTATGGEAVRVPWTTCPGAIGQLEALVGTPVAEGSRIATDPFQQCTHLLDTARLAIAQISRGGARTYDMLVRNGDTPDCYRASIARDGTPLFEWIVERDHVVAPVAFAGHMVRGRAEWPAHVEADPDIREAALVLRRCVFIFRSRPTSKSIRNARELPTMRDVCFSFQAARVDQAVRPEGFQEIDS